MISFYERQRPDVVAKFQRSRLSSLIAHASSESPWWRARLLGTQQGRDARFTEVPLLTRDDYRASIAAMDGPLPLPREHGRAHKDSTSGSSGTPLAFYVCSLAGRLGGAHYWQDRIRQGIDSSRRIVRFDATIGDHPGPCVMDRPNVLLGRSAQLRRRIQQFKIEEHARWVSEVKPAYVIGPPMLLSGIMDVYEAGDVDAPRVDRLLTFAETVTPEFRQRVSKVLGARTLDRYSCQEVGPIAFQCPLSDDYYHIASTNVIVEVLDEAGKPSAPGQTGRVFVTSLHNYASPVIRYELGDLASWLPECVCGHSQPVLTTLLGRKRFLIRLPDGTRKYFFFVAKHWLSVAPFKEARIVQVSEAQIRAEFVLDRPLTAGEHQSLLEALKREITPDFQYEIVQLERIGWGPTYKRQDVISLV
jgi:phenylacetate-CoA ligase